MLAITLVREALLCRRNFVGLGGTEVGVQSTALIQECLLSAQVIGKANVAEAISGGIWSHTRSGTKRGTSSINGAQSRFAICEGSLELLGAQLVEGFKTAR